MEKILEECFRNLRSSWFDNHLAIRQEQRIWETEEAEEERLARNKKYREIFDSHTDKILTNEFVPAWQVVPYCLNDLVREK
jgi:hypothetical protein